MNKTALAVTVVISAFVCVMVGGVYFGVRTAQRVLAANAPAPTPAPTEVTVTDQPIAQQIQAAVSQRDAAYKDLLDQANARIDALQKENQALKDQLNALQSNAPTGNSTSSNQAGITPQQAAQVAAFWVGDNQIFSVENVTIQDIPLYKVTFSSGVIVYVDLEGRVVGSQVPSQQPSSGSQSIGGGGEQSEHEGNDH